MKQDEAGGGGREGRECTQSERLSRRDALPLARGRMASDGCTRRHAGPRPRSTVGFINQLRSQSALICQIYHGARRSGTRGGRQTYLFHDGFRHASVSPWARHAPFHGAFHCAPFHLTWLDVV